jgi:hypothetical protein
VRRIKNRIEPYIKPKQAFDGEKIKVPGLFFDNARLLKHETIYRRLFFNGTGSFAKYS